MAASQNNEMTHGIEAIIKDIVNNITKIEYETIEGKLIRFDDIDEEPTIGDSAGLLFYPTQFAGGDHNIIQTQSPKGR